MKEKRILIVDDLKFNIDFESKLIQTIMKSYDYQLTIDEATSIKEALEKIETEAPYDAMIIDMNLPDGSGVQIAKEVKKKTKLTRIAALTIYPCEYEKERELFDMFLKKPLVMEAFKRNIKQLLSL
jgi:CheY-like chemotaxis protein